MDASGRTSSFNIRQLGTPWSDGVPGVSQRPIASGGSFTYKWTATQFGSYWYIHHGIRVTSLVC